MKPRLFCLPQMKFLTWVRDHYIKCHKDVAVLDTSLKFDSKRKTKEGREWEDINVQFPQLEGGKKLDLCYGAFPCNKKLRNHCKKSNYKEENNNSEGIFTLTMVFIIRKGRQWNYVQQKSEWLKLENVFKKWVSQNLDCDAVGYKSRWDQFRYRSTRDIVM